MIEKVIGVTGPSGFVATHVLRELEATPGVRAAACPREAWGDADRLAEFVRSCDAVIHLAGCNRGPEAELERTNVELAERLVGAAEAADMAGPLVFASSTQRELANPYGRSKRRAEQALAAWAWGGPGRAAVALVLPNVFGPGCRPYYNSVVATFCQQLAEDRQPQIVEDRELELAWVGDVARELVRGALDAPAGWSVRRLHGMGRLRVSELLQRLERFRDSERRAGAVPDITAPLDARLYATYRSYLPWSEHCLRPIVREDARGRLYEAIRWAAGGQVFFSTTKPGVIRGDHYHTRKVEWFCVVQGEAIIRLRRIGAAEVQEIRVSGERPEFVSIPVMHAHQIENVGRTDLLTMFWCNEIFDQSDADTWRERVA